MTLCPVALAVTCLKCPILGICPAKRYIGDIEILVKSKPKAPKKNLPK